jgi:hypothetical protein
MEQIIGPASIEVKKKGVFKVWAITGGAFFGGPFVGGWMLGENFKELGRPDLAKKYKIGGLILFVLLIILVSFVEIKTSLGFLAPVLALVFFNRYQKKEVEAYIIDGGIKRIKWPKICIIFTIILYVLAISSMLLGFWADDKLKLQEEQLQIPVTTNTDNSQNTFFLAQEPYVDTITHFKIYPPQGWTVEKTNNQTGTLVTFSEMNQLGTNGALIEVRLNSNANQSLDEYVEGLNVFFSKILSNFKQTENQKLIVNGREAIINSATFSLKDKVNGRMIQLTTMKEGQIWVVAATLGSLSTDAKYEDVVNASLRSFDLN